MKRATWCMGNAFRSSRPLTAVERRRIDVTLRHQLRRLRWARASFYGELIVLSLSLIFVHLGSHAWVTVLALATMPGVFGLVIGGLAIRPCRSLVAGLQADLAVGVVDVFGEEEVVRLPTSGLPLVLYGRSTDLAISLPIASGPPRGSLESYPARFEWRPERKRFALCRNLSSSELAELELLRQRIANRHVMPTIGFFTFGGLAVATLIQAEKGADPLIPFAVLAAGLWFVFQLLHDLSISARLGREHAVVTDQVLDGFSERAVEVLPSASLVWTIDRAPAGWRF